MPASQPADTRFDPEDHKSASRYDDDDDRHGELDERSERDLFDSPSDSWRELEDLEALMELEDEPTGRYE